MKLNNDEIAYNELTIAKGAALEVADINPAGANEIITNNGSLTLGDEVNTVNNYGELTINANGEFSTLKTDEEKPQTINLNRSYTFNGDKIEGTWTVANGATLTLGKVCTLPHESKLTLNGRLAGEDLTVSGTMDVNGTIANKVKVEGIIDNEATTTVNERKEAIVNLNAGAVITGTVEGENADNKDAQIVNIAKGMNGFMGTFTNTNLKATYTYTGNLSKPADIVIPANANTLKIDGNINATEDLRLTATSITELIITGDINATAANVTLNTDASSTVKVEGDVTTNYNVNFEGATKVEVEGVVSTSGTDGKLTAASVTEAVLGGLTLDGGRFGDVSDLTKLTIKGNTLLYQSMYMEENAELVLEGNVTIAKDIELRLSKKTTINGHVTFDGQGKVAYGYTSADGEIDVNAGCVLTNETTISGNSTKGIHFRSKEGAGKTRGQVYNNGTIKNALYRYASNDWWHGDAAEVK